jgi:hypothetical protein
MPFLAKKTGGAENNALIQGALGLNNGLAWQDDEYRPSQDAAGLKGV